MEMKDYHELVPNMDILREKTRNGSMKIFEDKKARYIGDIAKEMWRCAKIGKNEAHYHTALSDNIARKAFEKALEGFKVKCYMVECAMEGEISVSIIISWPLDL